MQMDWVCLDAIGNKKSVSQKSLEGHSCRLPSYQETKSNSERAGRHIPNLHPQNLLHPEVLGANIGLPFLFLFLVN